MGIEGRLDLINVAVPTGVVGAVAQVSEADPRTTAKTDYEGEVIVGMEPSRYRWVTGFDWGSNLDMSLLNGQVDLAARVKFLFFKKTFRKKIASLTGFQRTFVLAGSAGGEALRYSNDYGTQADKLAYSKIPQVPADGLRVAATGPAAPGCSDDPR